ncbi:MAG: VWA domain-containing protein [Sandaracinaceae bacterium]|nr:VWA domain-containing protein [Sandaracinaceae bacterium]
MRRCFNLTFALVLALAGCTAGNRPPTGSTDGATPMSMDSGTTPGLDATTPPPPRDAGVFDPFDPDGGCGASAIPTERLPGSLLIVFDRSGSMNNDTTPTRWQQSVSAINAVLATLSDDLNVGLQLFPYASSGSDNCTVELAMGRPNVPIAPLSTTRAQIMSALAAARPEGGTTPIYEAARQGYRYLDTLSGPGQRGIIVVTDGGNNCMDSERAAFLAQVQMERTSRGYLTYAVGLDESNNDLSTMAFNGGTPRTPDCLPECRNRSCLTNADCASGRCVKLIDDSMFPGIPIPGECSCRGDMDCPSPLTCRPDPNPLCGLLGSCADQCQGTANCCHYNAAGASFRAEFEAALADIASRFLDSCVFALPRGSDPASFDPALVNVGVTFDGEPRTVLRRSDDSSVDSWRFSSDAYESIVIQGPICDRLLSGAATVEIVLGCPTILI